MSVEKTTSQGQTQCVSRVFFFWAEFSKALLEARPIQTSLEGFESLKIGTSLELGVCLFACIVAGDFFVHCC